jgi:hypothetical protein
MSAFRFVLLLITLADAQSATHPRTVQTSDTCAFTKPNGEDSSYGNAALSTALFPDGTVVFRRGGPGSVQPDGSLAMKFGWDRHVRGKLHIEGRRLDAPAPPLRTDIPDGYGDIAFQATMLVFPTVGCWEVTGRVSDATLTFVTRVVKIEEAGK